MRRMIERAQAEVDNEGNRLRRFGILQRLWGPDQPPSPRSYAIDPSNKNMNAPLREKSVCQFAFDVRADAAAQACVYAYAGY